MCKRRTVDINRLCWTKTKGWRCVCVGGGFLQIWYTCRKYCYWLCEMTTGQERVLRNEEYHLKMTLLNWKYTLKLLMDRHLINTPFCAVKDKHIYTHTYSHTHWQMDSHTICCLAALRKLPSEFKEKLKSCCLKGETQNQMLLIVAELETLV